MLLKLNLRFVPRPICPSSLAADLPERGVGEAADGPVGGRAALPHLPHRPGVHAASREHQREVKVFIYQHIFRWFVPAATLKSVRVSSLLRRTAWVQKIKAASELFIETEKKKREKAYLGISPVIAPPHLLFCPQMSRLNRAGVHLFVSVRSQRATGIGRLMVNIVEGIELKPCRSHGRNTPPVHKYVTIITTGTMEVRAPVNIHVRL